MLWKRKFWFVTTAEGKGEAFLTSKTLLASHGSTLRIIPVEEESDGPPSQGGAHESVDDVCDVSGVWTVSRAGQASRRSRVPIARTICRRWIDLWPFAQL